MRIKREIFIRNEQGRKFIDRFFKTSFVIINPEGMNMTETKKTFSEEEFRDLCEYVCRQMTPSGSEEIDRETLYFAIYWKICDLTEEKLFTKCVAESKISDYRDKIRKS